MTVELVRPPQRKVATVDPERRRKICRQGHAVAHRAMSEERGRTGAEGLQAFAEGAARQIALELSLRVSTEIAQQIFAPSFIQDVLLECADRDARALTEEAP